MLIVWGPIRLQYREERIRLRAEQFFHGDCEGRRESQDRAFHDPLPSTGLQSSDGLVRQPRFLGQFRLGEMASGPERSEAGGEIARQFEVGHDVLPEFHRRRAGVYGHNDDRRALACFKVSCFDGPQRATRGVALRRQCRGLDVPCVPNSP